MASAKYGRVILADTMTFIIDGTEPTEEVVDPRSGGLVDK